MGTQGTMIQPVGYLPVLGWIAWFCVYALLVLLRGSFEDWLLLRFHRRRRQAANRSDLVIRMADGAGSGADYDDSFSSSESSAAESLPLRGTPAWRRSDSQADRESRDCFASFRPARNYRHKPVLLADALHARVTASSLTLGTAMVLSCVAGSAIPLAPGIQGLELGDTALLYVLGLDWISVCLLSVADDVARRRRRMVALRKSLGTLSLNALAITLLFLAVAMTASGLVSSSPGGLSLAQFVKLQGAWNGWRWLGVYQPLAFFLWLACAAPMRPTADARRTFAWQMHALNRALLTGTLFLGGWQGPLALKYAVLGLLYTMVKTGLVTFGWVWGWASLPQLEAYARSRLTWRLSLPLAVIVLVATSFVAAA